MNSSALSYWNEGYLLHSVEVPCNERKEQVLSGVGTNSLELSELIVNLIRLSRSQED